MKINNLKAVLFYLTFLLVCFKTLNIIFIEGKPTTIKSVALLLLALANLHVFLYTKSQT